MSALEDLLAGQLRMVGICGWVREYKFLPDRRFRMDFAFPNFRLGIDIQGGTYVYGRHSRPGGYHSDCEKANLAIEAGWRLFHFDSEMVKSGYALRTIERALREGES